MTLRKGSSNGSHEKEKEEYMPSYSKVEVWASPEAAQANSRTHVLDPRKSSMQFIISNSFPMLQPTPMDANTEKEQKKGGKADFL